MGRMEWPQAQRLAQDKPLEEEAVRREASVGALQGGCFEAQRPLNPGSASYFTNLCEPRVPYV